MKNLKFLMLLYILLCSAFANAKHLHAEAEYQKAWCEAHKGIMEYKLDDNTRVDCLTSHNAVEFDFASKWAESIGQSLYYGLKTNRTPTVVLIMENPKQDEKYLKRLKLVAEKYGIVVFTMTNL